MIEIWINCPDGDTARKISDALIARHRIACSNIFQEIQSCYRWKGRIENASEIPLLVKTRAEYFSQVVEDVQNMHPYKTQGIIGVPVEFVNEDYLAWVYSETC